MTDTPPMSETQQAERAHELIYCEDRTDYDELISRLTVQWPEAVFEDGSDDIHQYRFSVTIDGVAQDDLYRFALKNRFATQGLCFNLTLHKDTEHIKTLIDEMESQ